MIVLAAVLAAAQAAVAEPPALGPAALDARIKASAAAAQSLQGPWDGSWILRDAQGRALFVFQITDPADGGPLAGAWREADGTGSTGWLDSITRRGDGLDLGFTPAGQSTTTTIRLERRDGRSAAGRMASAGPRRAVTLTRGP
jgi:hypothetical protein